MSLKGTVLSEVFAQSKALVLLEGKVEALEATLEKRTATMTQVVGAVNTEAQALVDLADKVERVFKAIGDMQAELNATNGRLAVKDADPETRH